MADNKQTESQRLYQKLLTSQTPEQRNEENQRYAKYLATAPQVTDNPMYGVSQFEPSSYIPKIYGDPSLGQPLRSGRYGDPSISSPISNLRAEQITEFKENPNKYIEDHIMELNTEQSIMDKGKDFLGRLFDYTDDADLTLFGVPLGPVESTFDGFIRGLVGGYDLLSIGFGGIISAMPGGVDTIPYEELSNNKSVLEVLNGEIEPGSVPSPGQIAVTSVGIEAARIRNGGARLSDMILLNPATAPFLLAAMAAETSPLQKPGFDLLDDEQRAAAFGSGFEQWGSGVTDFGLMFADPLIGVGVGAKVARAGLLGVNRGSRYGIEMGTALDDAIEEVSVATGLKAGEIQKATEDVINIGKAGFDANGKKLSPNTPNVPVADLPTAPLLTGIPYGTVRPAYKNPLSEVLHDALELNEQGTKLRSSADIASRPEFKALKALAPDVGDLLHAANSIPIAALILKSLSGTPDAVRQLSLLDKGMADTMFRYQRQHYSDLAATEPAKVAVISEKLNTQILNIDGEIAAVEKDIARYTTSSKETGSAATIPDSKNVMLVQQLKDKLVILNQTRDEGVELFEIVQGTKKIDKLDPTSAIYNPAEAKAIVESYRTQRTIMEKIINSEIQGAALEARFQLPSRSNAYSRMVTESRGKRGTAAYQYADEGTSIFPHKQLVQIVNGKPIFRSDGWFTASAFDGTSRWGRNVRIWRWAGTETPSGYLGLKGVNAVGSDREMQAVLNLDLFSGKGVEVITPAYNANGSPKMVNGVQATETKFVGGIESRDKLLAKWTSGVNDPKVDNFDLAREIEKEIIDTFAEAYGQSQKDVQNLFRRADKNRMAVLDVLEKEGYWVGPDGTQHYAPYAQTSLASGTYMHNFQAFEKQIKLLTRDAGGVAELRRMFEVPAHMTQSAYAAFETVWRPATLLRASYTQRNVLENIIRASAYQASLAPLTWPVRATTNGIRNSIIKRTSKTEIIKTEKIINDSEYGNYLREYTSASTELRLLDMAFESVDDAGNVTFYVGDLTKSPRALTPVKYEKERIAVQGRVDNAKGALDTNYNLFTEAIKDTKFGKWRAVQLKALDEEILSQDAYNNVITELWNTSPTKSMDDLGQMFETVRMSAVASMKRDMLLYDSAKSLTEWRVSSIGRQRRIGSGTSLGPDGNYYANAFEGPFEAINRGALSSDNTIKQGLVVKSTVTDNFFRAGFLRNNVPIPYDPTDPKVMASWRAGMADFIEQASSNIIVRKLVEFDWDVKKVAAWMRTSDGNDTYEYVRHILHRMDGKKVDVDPQRPTITPDGQIIHHEFGTDVTFDLDDFGDPIKSSPSVLTLKDFELQLYVSDVRDKILIGTQHDVFRELLNRRVEAKKSIKEAPSDRPPATDTNQLTKEDIENALLRINEVDRKKLGYVKGDELIIEGVDSIRNVFRNFVNASFKAIGVIPEDSVARGPFYAARFKVMRNALIEEYLVRTGQQGALKKGKVKSHSGREQEGTISHDEVKISSKELERIYRMSHKRALADTREWLYTIERRTNLGKYGEWFSPFVSAQQNSVTTIGKLLWKEPWLAPAVMDLWRAPTRLGIEDENGNLTLPMPMSWMKDWLNDHPEVPVIGGIMDSGDWLTIPKDAFNVMTPETGYGFLPRPSAYIQVAASELMKANLVPTETPQILVNLFGKTEGDNVYKAVQDYMFGEQGDLSSKPLSYDKLLPAYVQKIWQSKDVMSAEYQKEYQKQRITQDLRTYARERDGFATPDEISERTTNAFFFAAFGNQGIPTPLTPYPLVGRPRVNTPLTALQEIQQRYRDADYENANMNMAVQLGDWALPAAAKSVTLNVGGAEPYASVVSDIKTFDNLISRAAPLIGDNLDVLGILVNNRIDASQYEGSARQWLSSTRITGQSSTWTEVQSAEQVAIESQKTAGWVEYNRFMDQLNAQMYSAGVKSTESAAGFPYKQAKQTFLASMSVNPEYQAWYTEFKDSGGDRTGAAYRVIELAIADPTFNKVMIESNKTQTLANMKDYVFYRRGVESAVYQSGVSINDPANATLKQQWATIQQGLINTDTRWGDIFNRYLSREEVPLMPSGQLGQADLGYAGTGMPLTVQQLESVG